MGKKRRGTSIKRVAIVGKGPGRGLAPRSPTPGVEIWGCNNVALQQSVDMIFDMHDLDWTMEENIANYEHLDLSPEEKIARAAKRDEGFKSLKEFSKRTGTPIMSLHMYAGINSRTYPLHAIIDKFDCDMFSCVTDYMLAYAVYQRYQMIDLYGINASVKEEYVYQRPSVTGWIMFAKGKGIKVNINGGKNRPLRLVDEKLYGYGLPQRERGQQCLDSWLEPPNPMAIAVDTGDRSNWIKKEFHVWRES